jgi:Tol biopolymer transport system component
VGVGSVFVYRWLAAPPRIPFQNVSIDYITGAGEAVDVVLSSDGRYIVMNHREGDVRSILVKQVSSGSVIQVAPPMPGAVCALFFSHDGDSIYFARNTVRDRCDLYIVPSLGGTPRLLMQDFVDGMLSNDGKRLAFFRQDLARGMGQVFVAEADGSNEHLIYEQKRGPTGLIGSAPSWSPDGKKLAVARFGQMEMGNFGDVLTIASDTGRLIEDRQLPLGVDQVRWIPDDSGFIVTASEKESLGTSQIWYVPLHLGDPQRITRDIATYTDIMISADSRTIGATESDQSSTIYLGPSPAADLKPIPTQKDDASAFAILPGGRIITESYRHKMFAMNIDGSGRAAIPTDSLAGQPVLCGIDHVVFVQLTGKGVTLWRMDFDGSNRVRIVDDGWSPACSPDGKEILFTRRGAEGIFQISVDGGTPVLLTKPAEIAVWPAYSRDGKQIAFISTPSTKGGAAPPSASIIVMETATHQQVRSLPMPPGPTAFDVNARIRFAPDDSGIYFCLTPGSASNIWFQPVTGGPATQVTHYTSDFISFFGWSPDFKTFAVSRQKHSWNGVLIRDLGAPH